MCLIVLSILIGIGVFLEENKKKLKDFCKTVNILCKALVLVYQHFAETIINAVAALAAAVAICVIVCKFVLIWSALILITGFILGSSWKFWTTGFMYAGHAVNIVVNVIKYTTGIDIYQKCYWFVFEDRVRQSWRHTNDMSKFFETRAKEQQHSKNSGKRTTAQQTQPAS